MIEKQLETLFHKLYTDGMTQQEIAKKYNVSQQVISRLLSGQRKCGGLSVITLDRMFPNAVLYFEGGNNVSIGNNGWGTVQGNNNTTTNNFSDSNYPALLKILDSNMSDSDKVMCIRVIVSK